MKLKSQCEHRVKLAKSRHGYMYGHIELN